MRNCQGDMDPRCYKSNMCPFTNKQCMYNEHMRLVYIRSSSSNSDV